MQRLQVSGVVDFRNSISQDTDATTEVVLADIFIRSSEERSIDDVGTTNVRDKIVQDYLADGS